MNHRSGRRSSFIESHMQRHFPWLACLRQSACRMHQNGLVGPDPVAQNKTPLERPTNHHRVYGSKCFRSSRRSTPDRTRTWQANTYALSVWLPRSLPFKLPQFIKCIGEKRLFSEFPDFRARAISRPALVQKVHGTPGAISPLTFSLVIPRAFVTAPEVSPPAMTKRRASRSRAPLWRATPVLLQTISPARHDAKLFLRCLDLPR